MSGVDPAGDPNYVRNGPWTDEQIGSDWWRVIANLGDEADEEVIDAIVTLIEKGIHPTQVRDLVALMDASQEDRERGWRPMMLRIGSVMLLFPGTRGHGFRCHVGLHSWDGPRADGHLRSVCVRCGGCWINAWDSWANS